MTYQSITHVDYVDFAIEVFAINVTRLDKVLYEIGIMHQGPRVTGNGKVLLETWDLECFEMLWS